MASFAVGQVVEVLVLGVTFIGRVVGSPSGGFVKVNVDGRDGCEVVELDEHALKATDKPCNCPGPAASLRSRKSLALKAVARVEAPDSPQNPAPTNSRRTPKSGPRKTRTRKSSGKRSKRSKGT